MISTRVVVIYLPERPLQGWLWLLRGKSVSVLVFIQFIFQFEDTTVLLAVGDAYGFQSFGNTTGKSTRYQSALLKLESGRSSLGMECQQCTRSTHNTHILIIT